jgi:prepilin-type N-terminal cleavage/methylation domain-containing protein
MKTPVHTLRKGFTLIELLVVISIIGMLSSVVLASLSSSRKKGNDAKIKTQIRDARNLAEIYRNSNNSFLPSVVGSELKGNSIGTGCNSGMFAGTDFVINLKASNYPAATVDGRCTVTLSGDSYTITSPLSSGGFWCIDGKGNTMQSDYIYLVSESSRAGLCSDVLSN